MQIPSMVGWIAAIGIVGSMWGNIRGFLQKIYNIFVIELEVEDAELTEAVGFLITSEFKNSSVGRRLYTGEVEYVRPRRRSEVVGYEMLPPDYTIFRRGWLFILVKKWRWYEEIKIQAFRFTFKPDQFISEACAKLNEYRNKSYKGGRYDVRWHHGSIGKNGDMSGINMNKSGDEGGGGHKEKDGNYRRPDWRPVGFDVEELGHPRARDPFDFIALDTQAKAVLREVREWRLSEDWHKDRGIAWKRGLMFTGKPGTGKTSFIRALAQDLDMPIHCFDISSMTNVDFAKAWATAIKDSPVVVLIEDIDNVFDGRKNISSGAMEHGVTFDFLLNMVDGVDHNDGVLFVITTNHPEKINDALGLGDAGDMPSRPGRIDRVIEMHPITDVEEKRKIAKRVFVDIPESQWEMLLDDSPETGAQVHERCVRCARKQRNTDD